MKKKSVKKSVDWFIGQTDEIVTFVSQIESKGVTDAALSWTYDHAIIRLYRQFELLMFDGIVAGINNDTSVLSKATGTQFPKHLTDEVCEFILVGNGYFDFKGRDGLISTLGKYLSENHYIVTAVKKTAYKDALNRLSALRNFAAHDSAKSKRAALKAIDHKSLGSSGSWLKRQGRFTAICDALKSLALEIKQAAPY